MVQNHNLNEYRSLAGIHMLPIWHPVGPHAVLPISIPPPLLVRRWFSEIREKGKGSENRWFIRNADYIIHKN